MEIIKPRTLSGFMELLPDKQIRFETMVDILRRTYASYGFAPLDTPAIEDAQILLAKGGGETEKQIYRFQKGDSDLALRFDLTVPLAKYVALHYNELAFPFRRYQISKVYRGERAQRGRFREFYQADIDIIGDGKLDILNEAEIPAIIYKVFRGFGLTRFQIRVNNRKILSGFYDMLGLSQQSGDIMRTVDKLDKIGADKVKVILMEECGLAEEQADEILAFIAIRGTNAQVIAALEGYTGRNELFDLGLTELKTVTANLSAFGVPEENFAVDLTIARGLDYYTGTVYETTLLDHPEIGSVCSGGRYDNLAGYYIEKSLPGVGISIGLTRLFYAGRAGSAESPAAQRPRRCAGAAHDRKRRPRHCPGRDAAQRRSAGAALRRTEEIQAEDGLCQQAGRALCGAAGRRRNCRGNVFWEEYAHRRTAEAPPGGSCRLYEASRQHQLPGDSGKINLWGIFYKVPPFLIPARFYTRPCNQTNKETHYQSEGNNRRCHYEG